ncbi:MAG: anaerobic ribonucleoside-triphosphate reductase, partial [Candidatus Bathyarchaeota archaeon]
DAYLMDVGEGYKANENANLQPNAETAHKRKADWVSGEEYLLLMPPKLADSHLSGDLHIHDLEYFGTRPFCQDWDLRYFFYYGLMPDGMGTRTSIAGPAKHAEVAILHTAKILASAQTNFAGGEGFYNFLVFLAPYVRGLSYERIKQLMQMMFFEYTQAYVARGGQLVFSNIQVQPGVPELWRNVPIVARGRVGPDVYGDYEDEVRLMFRALYSVAYKGDYWGKPFNFPKLENGISPEFFKPEYDEFWLDVHKVVAKFGTPYFDNMLPAYRGYGKGVSCYQCCAYCFVETPDDSPDFEDKLYFNDGKHFTMGSCQVVSLNLPRMAYKANGDDSKLFEEGRRLMDHAVEIFRVKKKWMNLILKHNRIPFATQRPRDPKTGRKGTPAVDFDGLAFTMGLVGGNEMAQWHTGYQFHEHPDAIRILVKLILEMQKYREELQEKSGLKLTLARTPAESTAQRFAVADLLTGNYRDKAKKLVKGDLNGARSALADGKTDVPVYYSNGTHLYVGAKTNIIDRIHIEQKFFPLLSGGNMLHVWLGQNSPDPEGLYKLTQKIATRTQVGYYAYTKDLTICNGCGRVTGGVNKRCPNCGASDLEWWSRVTGYYQAVSGWNEAKKKELVDRYRVTL